MSIFDDTIEVLTAATSTDPYTGEAVPDWTQTPATQAVDGEVQPLSSTEAVLTAGTVISRWRGFLDPTAQDGTATVVSAASRIQHDGTIYEIDGHPQVWKVAGEVDHYELILKLVEG